MNPFVHTCPAMTEGSEVTPRSAPASPSMAATDRSVEIDGNDSSPVQPYLAAMTAFFSGFAGDG
jgi:hypothetical protein